MPIVSARRSVATRSKTEAHQINYHPILRYDIIYRFYEFMSIYHNRLVIFLLYSRPKIGYDLVTQQPEVCRLTAMIYPAQCNDSDHFYAKDESLAPMTHQKLGYLEISTLISACESVKLGFDLITQQPEVCRLLNHNLPHSIL